MNLALIGGEAKSLLVVTTVGTSILLESTLLTLSLPGKRTIGGGAGGRIALETA